MSGRLELLSDTQIIFCSSVFSSYQQTDTTPPHKGSLEHMQWKDRVAQARGSRGEDVLVHQQQDLRSVCIYHETTLLIGQICQNGLEQNTSVLVLYKQIQTVYI